MSVLDLVCVLCVVAAAAAFLAWHMLKGPPPACHVTAGKPADGGGDDVILGAGLARGLARAEARRRAHRA